MDWRHRAVCRDEDPELFFPVGTSGPAIAQVAEAKTVCGRCPVVSECLALAARQRLPCAARREWSEWGSSYPRQRANTQINN